MTGKKRWALYGMGISMLLGRCADSDNTPQVQDQYERVQDYKGEGYSLNNGEENDKIAEAHRKEIEQAVKTFFIENYKTEVKVHNLVGNVDGATVFVESITPISELKSLFSKADFVAEDYNITIQLYMENENVEPDKKIFNKVQQDIKSMSSIPKGNYSVIINDNLINEKVDDGIKDNSLQLTFPDSIVKK